MLSRTALKKRDPLSSDGRIAYIDHEGITQEEAAQRLDVPRSRVSELVNDRIANSPSTSWSMAARVGLTTRITVRRARRRSVNRRSKNHSAISRASIFP